MNDKPLPLPGCCAARQAIAPRFCFGAAACREGHPGDGTRKRLSQVTIGVLCDHRQLESRMFVHVHRVHHIHRLQCPRWICNANWNQLTILFDKDELLAFLLRPWFSATSAAPLHIGVWSKFSGKVVQRFCSKDFFTFRTSTELARKGQPNRTSGSKIALHCAPQDFFWNVEKVLAAPVVFNDNVTTC